MVDKVVDEDYLGLHTVHGIGTFFFVDRWLRPERSAGRDYGCDGEHYCDQDMAAGFHGYGPILDVPYVTQLVTRRKNRPSVDGFMFRMSPRSLREWS